MTRQGAAGLPAPGSQLGVGVSVDAEQAVVEDDGDDRVWLPAIVAAGAVLLVAGWYTLWFQCDDAYIAFRYVAQRHNGHGYVWNPPPFAPVEGYTSFLWVALLDLVWTMTGVPPERAANPLGLLAALGSLGAVTALTWSAPWSARAAPVRAALTALVVVGTFTNRTFLTWTTSGLEAPLFVALLLGWVWAALRYARPPHAATSATPHADGWRREAVVAAFAGLAALARPDGYLLVLATLAWWAARGPSTLARRWPALLPLLLPVAHVLWRRSFYGEWLPNTWFAKDVDWWAEAGLAYLALWGLEGCWWTAVGVGVAGLARVASGHAVRAWVAPATWPHWVVAGALMAHTAYYTLRVGGDHFEFRVLAHLPPLVLLGALRLADRGAFSARGLLASGALMVALSWPVAWLDHAVNARFTTREETRMMHAPIAPELPGPLAVYGALHDQLEAWLVTKMIAVPRQTHRVFAEGQLSRHAPPEVVFELAGPELWGPDANPARGRPVVALNSVGVAGWSMPWVAIIDRLGLNDRLIARTPPPRSARRLMAHHRRAPPDYLACFRPNVKVGDRTITVKPRKEPLSDADIAACEEGFLRRVRAGEDLFAPPIAQAAPAEGGGDPAAGVGAQAGDGTAGPPPDAP